LNHAGGEKILAGVLQGATWMEAARTMAEPIFRISKSAESEILESAELSLAELRQTFEAALIHIYPQRRAEGETAPKWDIVHRFDGTGRIGKSPHSSLFVRPLVTLPVFPGTNCEWDMERAFREAGARTQLVVFRNRSAADIAASITELAAAVAGSQIIALSGGFSAGDEPDGSGKFIANVFRSPAVAGAVQEFLEQQGLML
jgi:phosphoribosylformylglycinamidine synthase